MSLPHPGPTCGLLLPSRNIFQTQTKSDDYRRDSKSPTLSSKSSSTADLNTLGLHLRDTLEAGLGIADLTMADMTVLVVSWIQYMKRRWSKTLSNPPTPLANKNANPLSNNNANPPANNNKGRGQLHS